MPTDPSILLQTQQPDFATIYGEAMQLRQLKQQAQTQNTLKMLAATPGMIDDKTGSWTPNALKQIFQTDPAAGQKASAEASQAAERTAQTAHTESETKTADLARHHETLSNALSLYDAELGDGNTDPSIAERGLKSSLKDYVDGLAIPDDHKAAVWGRLSEMTPPQLRQLANQWSMSLPEQRADAKDKSERQTVMMDDKPVLVDKEGNYYDVNTKQPIKVTGSVEHMATPMDPERVGFEKERLGMQERKLKLEEKAAEGGAGNLTDEDYKFGAEMVLNGQPMPNMGYGKAGAEARAKILHEAAKMATEQSGSAEAGADATVVRKESLKADQASLTSIAKQKASVDQFSRTALGMADKVEQTMDRGTTKSGPEWLAKLVQNIRTKQMGDADTREFLGYVTDLESENAKIMAGATGSVAQVSAHNQELMNSIIRGDMPASELKGALKTVRSGIALRQKSLDDELKSQKEGLRGDTAGGGKKAGYNTAADVAADFHAGKLTKEAASKILRDNGWAR